MKTVWEYRVFGVLDSWRDSDLSVFLNHYGAEGWEIVCLLPEPPGLGGKPSGRLRFVAKRELPVESS